MQLSELVTEVYRRIDESENAPAYWLETDVIKALNEGYEEISDATEWCETNETLSFVQDILYYDINLLFSSVPPFKVTGIFNNQTSRWLRQDSVNNLDKRYASWQQIGGEPEVYIVRGLWMIGLWPRPDANSGSAAVYFSSMPALLVADADTPGFPAEFHFALIEYALYELMSQDAETKESLVHYQRYKGYEQRLKLWTQERTLDRLKGYVNA